MTAANAPPSPRIIKETVRPGKAGILLSDRQFREDFTKAAFGKFAGLGPFSAKWSVFGQLFCSLVPTLHPSEADISQLGQRTRRTGIRSKILHLSVDNQPSDPLNNGRQLEIGVQTYLLLGSRKEVNGGCIRC